MIDLNDLSQFPSSVREYAAYKSSIQGCSPKTVTEYLFDLRTFCRYLRSVREGLSIDDESLTGRYIADLDADFFRSVTESDIYSFLYYAANGRSNGVAARSRKLSAIKNFYRYLETKKHLVDKNPAQNIEGPKKKKQLPKHLTLEECRDLLDAVENDAESNTRERDFCILTLFLNCGMRLSELAGISLVDIDPELRSLKVMGKGAKERIVYLNDACRSALIRYLEQRPALLRGQQAQPALFLSGRGNRISVKTVQWMVKKYLSAAGLSNRSFSTHKLRHTAATLMYQSGEVDIRVLKDILGHEQLNTTQIYTHVSNEGMESAMQKNPLANIKPKEKPDTDE